MELTVHAPADARPDLVKAAEELGVRLTPVHPDTSDPNLAAYYTVQVSNVETARQVIDRFRQLDAAAYLKPAEEPP